jgi:hypothetical protein
MEFVTLGGICVSQIHVVLHSVSFCSLLPDSQYFQYFDFVIASESQMRAFEECVSDAIVQHNQLAEDSDR